MHIQPLETGGLPLQRFVTRYWAPPSLIALPQVTDYFDEHMWAGIG